MRKSLLTGLMTSLCLAALLVFSNSIYSQGKIDWSKDTISRADAAAAKLNYLNNIKGGGNSNATEQVTIPVDKLKYIMDACTANNISTISIFMVKIRQADLVHYRKHNPDVSDNDLKGSQMIVIKVPRYAFGGQAGSKAPVPANNKLMISLVSAGLLLIDYPLTELLGESGDVLFSFGKICPPPASCGD